MRPPVVAVGGGWSTERDVSLASRDATLASLLGAGREARGVDLAGPDGLDDFVAGFSQWEVALLCLHGNGGGEEGLVQAALEAAGVPYTGSGPAASALALDKPRAKALAASLGLATPPCLVLGDDPELPEFAGHRDGIVVKPADHGSSDGVAIVHDEAAFRAAVAGARRLGRVMAEPFVPGDEVTLGVLGEDAAARALSPVRIRPRKGAFYDRESKYTRGGSGYEVDPDLGAWGAKAQKAALAVHRAIGCRGGTRADFILGERLWFLEINTLPGLTELSLLPMSAAGAGLGFVDLLDALVDAA